MKSLVEADHVTLREALISGCKQAVQHWLLNADTDAKLKALGILAGHVELVYSANLLDSLPAVLSSIGKLSANDINSNVCEKIENVLTLALGVGNVNVFHSILDEIIPDQGLPMGQVTRILRMAAVNLRQPEFCRTLRIQSLWTVRDSYNLLQSLATSMEGPDPAVVDLLAVAIHHIEALGLLRDAVNYIPPGETCAPDCKQKHGHKFMRPLLWTWVNSGYYEVARLITPFVDHDLGVPSTLYYVLRYPDHKVLEHVDFLMELGEEHRRYVCYPITNATVLHITAKSSRKYPDVLLLARVLIGICLLITDIACFQEHYSSPTELTRVLETLLEYFIDYDGEDIDVIDKDCCTALMWAADYASPEAVKLLLNWDADPTLQQSVRPVMNIPSTQGEVRIGRAESSHRFTPYEFTLFQIFCVQIYGIPSDTPPGFNVLNSALPLAKGSYNRHYALKHRQFRTLAMLSSPEGQTELQPYIGRDEVMKQLYVNTLVPRTKRLRAEMVEREDKQLYLDVWGVYILDEYRISMQISPEEMEITTDMLVKVAYYNMRVEKDSEIIRYTYLISNGQLFQFMIERRPGGWDETQDWAGPESVLTWEIMTNKPENPLRELSGRAESVDNTDTSSNIGDGSFQGNYPTFIMPLEDNEEETIKILESWISELSTAPDNSDEDN